MNINPLIIEELIEPDFDGRDYFETMHELNKYWDDNVLIKKYHDVRLRVFDGIIRAYGMRYGTTEETRKFIEALRSDANEN